jgi:hypothetical protein
MKPYEAIERVFRLLCEHCPAKGKGHCDKEPCEELKKAREELGEMEAKLAYKPDTIEKETLISWMQQTYLLTCDEARDLYEYLKAHMPREGYVPIGALRTLAKMHGCPTDKHAIEINCGVNNILCWDCKIAYAIAHPTEVS